MLSITKATLPQEAQIISDVIKLCPHYDKTSNIIHHILSNTDSHFYIARFDGKPIGIYELRFQNNKFDYRNELVIPEYDTRNIRRKLFDDFMDNMNIMYYNNKHGIPY